MEQRELTAAAPPPVEVRSTPSPRPRRYGSDGPVVTAADLNGHARTEGDGEPHPGLTPAPPAPPEPTPPPSPEPTPPPSPEPTTPPTQARRYRRCLLRRACCCLTLRQGAVVIGVLQVANGLLLLLLEVMYLAGVLYVGAYAQSDDLTGTLPGHEQRWGPTDIAYASLSGVLLLQELLVLFFAGLLLHGARTGRPGFVRGWLFFTGAMLAVFVGTWAARLTLEFMYKASRGGVLLVRALIEMAPSVYFLLVVRSFYYELLDGAEGAAGDEAEGAAKGASAVPLVARAPPPYRPPSDGPYALAAAPLQPKRPLETSFDALGPDAHAHAHAHAHASDDDEGGFGEGWGRQEEAGPLPRKAPPPGDGGPFVEDGRAWRRSAASRSDDDGDYDEVEEMPRASRRVAGAGPMVLPPLPPGHRESLQPVGLAQGAPTSL